MRACGGTSSWLVIVAKEAVEYEHLMIPRSTCQVGTYAVSDRLHDEESLFTTEPKAAILKRLWNNANR